MNSHLREDGRVWYKGYAERVILKIRKPLIWRRVVFWSHHRISQAVPFRFPHALFPDVETYGRRGDYFNTDNPSELELDALFKGTIDQDYNSRNRWEQKISPTKNRVVFDKTMTFNPGYRQEQFDGTNVVQDATNGTLDGHLINKRFWHGGKKCSGPVIYDDRESGSLLVSNDRDGWSSWDPKSRGNLYILDIFTQGYDTGTAYDTRESIGTVAYTGTSYWHEK